MRKPPFFATLFTLLGLMLLLGLSYWQVQRLHWKAGIIVELDRLYGAETGQPLSFNDEDNYQYGYFEGVMLTAKGLLLGPRTHEGQSGYHAIIPVYNAQAGRTVLVNMGWTDGGNFDDFRSAFQDRKVRIEGLARKPDWSAFASKNSPENDLWFRADIDEIATEKDLSGTVAPFILYVYHITPEISGYFPARAQWYPYNKHAQYALFWGVMALALAGIYAARFVLPTSKKAG